MRVNELVRALEPVEGMLLMEIEDCDRQETMDTTLEVIRGWKLSRVIKARLERLSHPGGIADVHLEFMDGGRAPAFTLSMRAREVHRVSLTDVTDDGGTARKRAELLFKRGHVVALELV